VLTSFACIFLNRSKRAMTPKERWNIRWAQRSEFRQILITRRMLLDHLPFRQMKCLRLLNQQVQAETKCSKQ